MPDGYACLRIDARGAGRSPGFLDPWSPRETRGHLPVCIEWAAGAAVVQRQGRDERHLVFRDEPVVRRRSTQAAASRGDLRLGRRGRLVSRGSRVTAASIAAFSTISIPRAFHRVQHGLGERGLRSRVTGELVSGPPTLSDEELERQSARHRALVLDHRFDDAASRERTPDFGKITVPLLSAANWGGQGLHPRGNFEGFLAAASTQKWLEVHGDAHWSHFYTDYGCACRSGSSGISSRARTPAGTSNRASSCRSAIPARSSSSGTRTNGRSRARNGRSSISIRRDMSLRPASDPERSNDARL